MLTFEQFGIVGLFNSFSYTVTVFFTALHATVNSRVAFLNSQYNEQAGYDFLRSTRKKVMIVGILMAVVWIIMTPLINMFFHTGYYVSLPFAPIILLGFITYANGAYLQGSFSFSAVAAIVVSEVIVKITAAWLLVSLGLREWAYLAIPISAVFAFALSGLIVWYKHKAIHSIKDYAFPRKFYVAAVIAGFASMAFLTFDLMLAKHFLSPRDAGQYALLSLIGKMVYFFGALPNLFLITLISRDVGKSIKPNRTYYMLLGATVSLLAGAYMGLVVLGHQILPLVFGSKVTAIFPYLNTYAAAISLLVISGSITSFHLVRKQYLFPIIAIAAAIFMCLGLAVFHENIYQFTHVILYTALVGLAVTASLHVLEARGFIKLKEGI